MILFKISSRANNTFGTRLTVIKHSSCIYCTKTIQWSHSILYFWSLNFLCRSNKKLVPFFKTSEKFWLLTAYLQHFPLHILKSECNCFLLYATSFAQLHRCSSKCLWKTYLLYKVYSLKDNVTSTNKVQTGSILH
jgi:hypothetical protein